MNNLQNMQYMPNIQGMNQMNPQLMQMPFTNLPNMGIRQNNSKQQNTLYVGNLHPEMKDLDLFRIFTVFGKVISIRIAKNTYTNESRCFGFVVFEKHEDAKKAQADLNNSDIMMREIRVYFKRNVRDIDQSKNFVIKNLSKDISSRQLNDEFNKFGKVISCFVRKEEIEGRMESLGYGYVQFDNDVNTDNFLSEFNGKKLNDQEISVENFIPPSQRAKPEPKNLYLKQFPDSWTKEDIEKFITEEIAKVSPIDSHGVFCDKKLNKFYCFVSLNTVEGAKEVIVKFNEKALVEGAEPLYVGVAESKSVRRGKIMRQRMNMGNETNLYVRSLKEDVTEEAFKAVFGQYGEVTSVCLKKWVMKNPQNNGETPQEKNLKFGFVNYKTKEGALRAFNEYKNNETLKEMVDLSSNSTSFVFFFQPKRIREQYKRMTIMNKKYMGGMGMNMNMGMNMGMGMQPGMMQNMQRRQMMQKGMMPQMNNLHFQNVPMPQMQAPTNMTSTPRTERSFQNSTSQSYTNPVELSISQQIENLNDIQEKANVISEKKEEFDGLSEDEKKNILGNIMFLRVKGMYKGKESDLPKITGMLIDLEVLDLDEILDIIKNDETLKERLEEAVEVLEDSE